MAVGRHHRRRTPLQEEHLVVIRNAHQFSKITLSLGRDLHVILPAVRHLEHAHSAPLVVHQVSLHFLEHIQRQRRRSRREVIQTITRRRSLTRAHHRIVPTSRPRARTTTPPRSPNPARLHHHHPRRRRVARRVRERHPLSFQPRARTDSDARSIDRRARSLALASRRAAPFVAPSVIVARRRSFARALLPSREDCDWPRDSVLGLLSHDRS